MSLGAPEPQVLASTRGGTCGHCVRLRRQQDAIWLVLEPEFIDEAFVLRVARTLALARNQEFPADQVMDVRAFDDSPAQRDLRDVHAHANRTATFLGLPSGPATFLNGGFAPRRPAPGRLCHPGCESFGDEAPDDVVSNPATGVDERIMGLTLLVGRWWPEIRVRDDDADAWLAGPWEGPRRDPRVASDERVAGGKRPVSPSDYMGLLRSVDRSMDKCWPHCGPPATAVVPSGGRRCGRELVTCDEFLAQTSGVLSGSNLRLLHKTTLHASARLQSYGQVDVPALAGAECLARRAVHVQRAVRANPKCPTLQGLEKRSDHTHDDATGLMTRYPAKHFAEISVGDARVMKQQRLLRSEMNARRGGAPPGADSDDDAVQPAQRHRNRPMAKAKAARPPG